MDNLLQKRLLDMLSWFHTFCVEHQLRYYLLGGTMLGAVRHQGFIPWDDDIDVGMPRRDYETFMELTKGQTFGHLVVEGIHTDKNDFYYGFTKIYDTETTLVEATRYQIKRGIFLDVFPLDGVADQPEDIGRYYTKFMSKYGLLLSRTCAYRRERKWYKNMAVFASRLIPNFIVSNKALMLSVDELCKQRDYDDYAYVGNLYGHWGLKEIVKKEVMGTPTLYRFENLEVYGVEDYETYLTSLYGDWRQLPPKEKQVTPHDYVERHLNKSYLEENAE